MKDGGSGRVREIREYEWEKDEVGRCSEVIEWLGRFIRI